MAAWVIANILKVNDQAAFAEYRKLAGGSKIEVGDGDWSPVGVNVIEFESLAKAKEWYNSPEYQAVVSRRISSTDGGLIFVDGG